MMAQMAKEWPDMMRRVTFIEKILKKLSKRSSGSAETPGQEANSKFMVSNTIKKVCA